jgi:integrase
MESLTKEEVSDLKKMFRLFEKLERFIDKDTFAKLEKNLTRLIDVSQYKKAAQSIFNKAKAACAFIIFFTSGLRIGDVASLKQECCKPSVLVDQIYYIDIEYLQKTSNAIHIPVPERTKKAIDFAAKLKMTSSPYIFDWLEILPPLREPDKITEPSLNVLLRKFTTFFNIPFNKTIGEGQHSSHDCRVTVAGWMGSASNFAIILVRRLFGHSNDVMPSTYLNNNPFFTKAKEEQASEAAMALALAMTRSAKEGNLAGKKGEQLEAGFKEFEKKHKSDFDKNKSASLSDVEILETFSDIIQRRIMNGSICGFITPIGVACGRNPINPEPAPCGVEAYKMYMKKWDIDPSVLKNLTLMDPKNCIGGSCKEAIIGPWSQAILDSLIYYQDYLRGLYPEIGDKEFKTHAEAFIAQYTEPMKKVFGEEVVRIIGEEHA